MKALWSFATAGCLIIGALIGYMLSGDTARGLPLGASQMPPGRYEVKYKNHPRYILGNANGDTYVISDWNLERLGTVTLVDDGTGNKTVRPQLP